MQAALDGVSAVLITHEHVDHLHLEELRSALERDPRLQLWAPESVAGSFAQFGDQVMTASAGQAFDAAGFSVRTFGGQHALIHPSIPMIANVGYLVEDAVFHPGDSFVVPPAAVSLLLAPTHAPWSKTAEVIDFVVAVRAPRTVGIHDALLTDPGRQLVESHVARIGAEHGSDYTALRPGETHTV